MGKAVKSCTNLLSGWQMFYSPGVFSGISHGHETEAEEIELLCSLSLVLQGSFATRFSCNPMKCEKRYVPPDFSYNCALCLHR